MVVFSLAQMVRLSRIFSPWMVLFGWQNWKYRSVPKSFEQLDTDLTILVPTVQKLKIVNFLINFSKRDCLYLGHCTYSALWLPFMFMPMPRKIEKMVNNTQTRATVANLLTNLTPKNTMVPRIITRKVPYTRKLLNFTEASLMSGPKRDICGPIT